jgi:1-aminocyclopropane-1-carboxylate deaminase/D-cysteine desulfhydrase-like pyridoxal-dependent ACC family enzyme
MSTDYSLFTRYPALRRALPIINIGHFPTRVSQAESLTRAEGFEIDNLWFKHDEQCAPAYGGNKIRKLEFLLGDAIKQGSRSVFTYGGAGSNHALATSINCHEHGLLCTAILTPEPATAAVRNTLRYHVALGTNIKYARHYDEIHAAAEEVRDEMGEDCYEIPFGGSSWVGCCGFVNAAFELADQIESGALPAPDVIYLAMGTTGSAVGLALGLQIAGLPTRIEAVQVTPASMRQDQLFARLFAETNKELFARDAHIPILTEPFAGVTLRTDQLGKGYAIPTDAAREAAALVMEHLGIPVSLTYTGKALAALIADARQNKLDGQNVLFWNTYNAQPYPGFNSNESWRNLPEELHEFFDPDTD